MRIIIFLITTLCLNHLIAQNPKSIEPIDGMPKFVSEDFTKKFDPSYYYVLDAKPFFEHLILVHKGVEKNTTNNFWLFKKKVDSPGYSCRNVLFENDSGKGFSSKIILTIDEDELSPLLLNFDKDYHLSYSWENEPSPKIIKVYPYKIGSTLPDLTLKNSKERISLSELKGKIVVINWWETRCTPCILEIPGLNTLVKKYDDIAFISIINDDENLEEFLKKHEFNYTHYFGNETILKIMGDGYPRNIILNKEGIIVHNKIGAHKDSYKKLEKVILTLKLKQ